MDEKGKSAGEWVEPLGSSFDVRRPQEVDAVLIDRLRLSLLVLSGASHESFW